MFMVITFFKCVETNVIESLYVEKKRMPKGKHIWKVQPLVWFENDFFSESNIKVGDRLIVFLPHMYIRSFFILRLHCLSAIQIKYVTTSLCKMLLIYI